LSYLTPSKTVRTARPVGRGAFRLARKTTLDNWRSTQVRLRYAPRSADTRRNPASGAAQESNLPSRGLHDLTGFEDFRRNGPYAGKILYVEGLRASLRAGPVAWSVRNFDPLLTMRSKRHLIKECRSPTTT
jgi:hypothetical protein